MKMGAPLGLFNESTSSIRANTLATSSESEWEPLRDLARSYGWQVP